MSNLSIRGEITLIKPERHISDKFSVREYVVRLDDDGKWPQFCQFQMTNQQCDELDKRTVGDMVQVNFYLRGREWTPKDGGETKYFTTLQTASIELLEPAVQNIPPEHGEDEIPF